MIIQLSEAVSLRIETPEGQASSITVIQAPPATEAPPHQRRGRALPLTAVAILCGIGGFLVGGIRMPEAEATLPASATAPTAATDEVGVLPPELLHRLAGRPTVTAPPSTAAPASSTGAAVFGLE